MYEHWDFRASATIAERVVLSSVTCGPRPAARVREKYLESFSADLARVGQAAVGESAGRGHVGTHG